jgi:hypothetical protein
MLLSFGCWFFVYWKDAYLDDLLHKASYGFTSFLWTHPKCVLNDDCVFEDDFLCNPSGMPPGPAELNRESPAALLAPGVVLGARGQPGSYGSKSVIYPKCPLSAALRAFDDESQHIIRGSRCLPRPGLL